MTDRCKSIWGIKHLPEVVSEEEDGMEGGGSESARIGYYYRPTSSL